MRNYICARAFAYSMDSKESQDLPIDITSNLLSNNGQTTELSFSFVSWTDNNELSLKCTSIQNQQIWEELSQNTNLSNAHRRRQKPCIRSSHQPPCVIPNCLWRYPYTLLPWTCHKILAMRYNRLADVFFFFFFFQVKNEKENSLPDLTHRIGNSAVVDTVL